VQEGNRQHNNGTMKQGDYVAKNKSKGGKGLKNVKGRIWKAKVKMKTRGVERWRPKTGARGEGGTLSYTRVPFFALNPTRVRLSKGTGAEGRTKHTIKSVLQRAVKLPLGGARF